MDKQSKPKPKSKIMKFLPRAASAVTFQNPPISPGRENRPLAGRGFSGPIKISIIPHEARRSKSNNSGFETPEPTSPKVSCIGQIKHKKKIKELAKRTAAVEIPEPKKRHPPSAIKRILTGVKVLGRTKSNVAAVPEENRRSGGKRPPLPERAPGLNQMKRYSSGRGALANFDWTTAQIAPADVEGEKAEDEESGGGGRRLSAEIWIGEEVGPLQPRKEVNIWKRRTVVPPTPLQLNST